MNENSNLKNLIIATVVVVLTIVFGYMYINKDTTIPENELLTTVSANTNTAMLEGNFLLALNSLKRLKIDDSIFSSPLWGSLTDFGRTLAPQPAGRENPFAPVTGAPTGASPTQ
jgi:hypothetical protein